MPSNPSRRRLAGCTAALLLTAAAPSDRLSYAPEVFIAGECLSPSVSGCGTIANAASARRPASEALLDAGREPRLELDMAVLLDIEPAPSAEGMAAPSLPR